MIDGVDPAKVDLLRAYQAGAKKGDVYELSWHMTGITVMAVYIKLAVVASHTLGEVRTDAADTLMDCDLRLGQLGCRAQSASPKLLEHCK